MRLLYHYELSSCIIFCNHTKKLSVTAMAPKCFHKFISICPFCFLSLVKGFHMCLYPEVSVILLLRTTYMLFTVMIPFANLSSLRSMGERNLKNNCFLLLLIYALLTPTKALSIAYNFSKFPSFHEFKNKYIYSWVCVGSPG